MQIDCPHVTEIQLVPDGGSVCPACVAMNGTWVNLRQCLICGVVGCCDSSPNTHATRHFEATGHPVIRSIMPGEDWMWCNVDEVGFRQRQGSYVAIDEFFDAGMWFIAQRPVGSTVADLAPDEVTPEGFPLGEWVAAYRERGRRGELDEQDRAALEAIPGWTW
jgi:hypothetical protein